MTPFPQTAPAPTPSFVRWAVSKLGISARPPHSLLASIVRQPGRLPAEVVSAVSKPRRQGRGLQPRRPSQTARNGGPHDHLNQNVVVHVLHSVGVIAK